MAAERNARGERVLVAAVAVIAARGLAGVSMRTVAAAAGVSLAQVQYYFRSKDDLVAGAFGFVGDRFLESVDAVLPGDPSWERLRTAIRSWLPLDDTREQAARVWLAFTAAAAVTPRLATMAADLDGRLRDWFTGELENLRVAGLLAVDIDSRTVAAQLLALIDGVTGQALSVPLAERQALCDDTIERFVDRLADTHQPSRVR